MNENRNNVTQTERKTFWESNIWTIAIAAIGGIITLYIEYTYFQNDIKTNTNSGMTFSAIDNFLGYLFAGVFLFFVLFFFIAFLTIFSSEGEGCALFGFFLLSTIISGVFITVSAKLGLNSSKKSIIVIENIYDRLKSTKTGKEITKKIDKLNINTNEEKIDYALKLDKYINTIDSIPKVSKFTSFYFFNFSEIKTYMLNNKYATFESGLTISEVSKYAGIEHYKGKYYTYASKEGSLDCVYFYNNQNDTLDRILLFTQNREDFNRLRNSILSDSCYKYVGSNANTDDYFYSKFIVKNPTDEDVDWAIEAEIRFEESPPFYYKDENAGIKNYFISIMDFRINHTIYNDEKFGYFKNEGRKRYLESIK